MIKAALAHLWFVTIHPFDDGNGRIARTVTDMLLSRDENSPKRFYSLSSQIMAERNDDYHVLNSTCGFQEVAGARAITWTGRNLKNKSCILRGFTCCFF
jgi:Fic family protein